MGGHRLIAALLVAASLGAAACTSRDERATAAAAIAADAFQQGDLKTASMQIGKALAARDDVSDYWLLSGRIALAAGRQQAAFDAFESTVSLDHTNVEALTRLCQLGFANGHPEVAARYADQLAALNPNDPAALTIQAAVAAQHGDRPGAMKTLDRVLAANPDYAMAQLTKSRIFFDAGDFAAAAQAAQASLASPGDLPSRLKVLAEAYRRGGNAAGYRTTIARLAREQPRSPAAQLELARVLYDAGDAAGGFAASRRALALAPRDANADAVLRLWLNQGAGAMPLTQIAAAAAGGSPELRATYAAYANARRRPDLALAALGDAGASGPPATEINDAKIARAEAAMLTGRAAEANDAVTAVLAADPGQPRALILRGRLRAAAGDRAGAIEDLRHAVASAPASADARLALADQQLAAGDGVLAIATLGDGLSDDIAEPRLAARLAMVLRRQGRAAEAAAALVDYHRIHPFAPVLTPG